MGEFTTSTRASNTSFVVTKYILLLFIVLNMFSSIWVGIYNKNKVDQMKIKYPDDPYTGDKGRGHAAELWEKLCITFLVFENIFNLMGLVAALQEHYCLSIGYSVSMFICSLYGSAGKYIRGSVCSYLMPLLVAVVASFFAHQIRTQNYEPTHTIETERDLEANDVVEEPIYSVPKKNKKMSPNTRAKHLSNPLIAESESVNKEEGIEMNGFKSLNRKSTYL